MGKIKILVIEDDPDVIEFIRLILDSLGGETEATYCQDGFNVGIQIAKFSPQLIILDLMLPGADGFDICKNVRLNPRLGKVKIIAITGFDTPENREKIINCGADDYLAKPFELNQFREILKKYIS